MAELEAEASDHLVGHEEVATALTLRAIQAGDFERAVTHGRRAATAAERTPGTYTLLGEALLRTGLVGPTQDYGECPRIRDRARVQEAKSAFDKALELAEGLPTADFRVEAMLGRALAESALGEDRKAEADYNKALALMPEHPAVLTRVAMHYHRCKRYGDAVENLQEAVRLGGGTTSEFLLVLALYDRNNSNDRIQALELVRQISGRSDSVHQRAALHLTIDWLLEAGPPEEAEVFLNGSARECVSRTVAAIIRAKIRLARGDREGAVRDALDALSGTSHEEPWEDRRELALLLVHLDLMGDALKIWREIVHPAQGDPDTLNLVKCAIQSGQDGVALDACVAFRGAGHLDPRVLHKELDLLEVYDPDEAVGHLRDYLNGNPGDRLSRLRLSLLGLVLGRPALVAADLADLPPVEEIAPVNGLAAVMVLMRSGRAEEALRYAYQLLRRHFDVPAAHQAYFGVMIGWGEVKPEIASPSEADLGVAVCYSEEGESRDEWVVLEAAPNPDPARGEYGPDHPLIADLKGKRVGDRFVLARGSAGDRVATVREIQSKYIFRAQESMRRWQVLFRDAAGPELYRLRTTTQTGEEQPDFGAILAAVDRQHRQIEEMEEAYRSGLVPINLFGKLTGVNTIESMFHLVARPGILIRCCNGSLEEKVEALNALESCERIVLELTTLSTLLLLGIEQQLRDWPARFVVSRGTVQELRSLVECRRLGMPDGRLFKVKSGYAYVKPDAQAWGSELLQLDGLVDLLESSCEVCACRELAYLDPEERKNLIQWFGQHGAESLLLSSRPGHIIWTDDLALAQIAKNQFEVRRVWTQLALEARAVAGSLNESTFLDACARLLGCGYEFTGFNEKIIARAAEIADFDAYHWPLEQALDQFANEKIELKDRVRTAALALIELMPRTVLPERRQRVVIRIAERLAATMGGHDAVRVLSRLLPTLFGQDSLHAFEATEILAAWLAASDRRVILPNPSIHRVRAPRLILPGSIITQHSDRR